MKLAARREKARLRQQKRRESMSAQKKRRERERRMELYYKKKTAPQSHSTPIPTSRRRLRLDFVLQGLKTALNKSRGRVALLKLDLIKKISTRQTDHALCHKKYYQRLPNVQSAAIVKYFQKVAVDYPGKKGSSVQRRILTKTLRDSYTEFKRSNPGMKVSFSTFKRNRPSTVILSNNHKFIQCLCERCVNAMLLMTIFNRFLDKRPDNRDDLTLMMKISSAEELVSKTLCKEVKRECVDRRCENCGIEGLLGVIQERIEDCDQEVREWRRWEKTVKSNKDLVTKSDTLSNILERLRQDLLPLAKHVKTAQWQRHQYQHLADNLPPLHGLLTMDFAENYLCKFQNEIQSAHWSYRQVTVHPCVFFYQCPKQDCNKRVTDYLIFLSDDLKHDSFFTKHIADYCINYLQSKQFVSIHMFSDGCPSQYKSKIPFFHLSELQLKYPQVYITRHFFGSNHGKSLCDSSGGTVKNCATRAVACGDFSIQSAQEMFSFCEQRLILNDEHHQTHVHRSFVLVGMEDVQRSQKVDDLTTVQGTRLLHRFFPTRELGTLRASALSCFCSICLLGEEGTCEHVAFTGDLKSITVQKQKVRSCERNLPNSTKTPCQYPPVDSDPAASLVDSVVDPFSGDLSRGQLFSDQSFAVDSEPPNPSSGAISAGSELNNAFCEAASPYAEQESSLSEMNSSTDDSFSNISVPCPVSPVNLSFPDTRKIFFDHIQSQMSLCQSFSELCHLLMTIEPIIMQQPLPDINPVSILDVSGSVDKVAYGLVPQDLRTTLLPVLTIADGNCVARALSLLVFHDQDHHQEIRCRIACELAVNPDRYISDVSAGDLKSISELSDFYCGSVKETYQAEVLDITKMCTFMGMWQLMAACNVFNMPLMSVYPSLGLKSHVSLLNRTLFPHGWKRNGQRPSYSLNLFWSSTRTDMAPEYWTANHVVPLMPIS